MSGGTPVVRMHRDDVESPLANPPRTDGESARRREALIAAVRAESPQEMILLEYLAPCRFG
ncbi:hypothetical protein [Nocardia xishanensis]|uniref:Uncharacterized protein n=1 Tax=Nocardia xishanensis TaxID=238964 RepID=A0ABW7X1R2_9NOCA